jgi:hypothetical protein
VHKTVKQPEPSVKETATLVQQMGPELTGGLVSQLGAEDTAALVSQLGGQLVGELVGAMGPDLTGDLVRRMGPRLVADLVAGFGAALTAGAWVKGASLARREEEMTTGERHRRGTRKGHGRSGGRVLR